MIRTEAEAAKCWCPFARQAGRLDIQQLPDGPAVNRRATGTGRELLSHSLCIGSKCMAWRWVDKEPSLSQQRFFAVPDDVQDEHLEANGNVPLLVEPTRPANVPASATWVPEVFQGDSYVDGGHWLEAKIDVDARNAQTLASRRGYCGLAGGVLPHG